jgi:hypothetical protein
VTVALVYLAGVILFVAAIAGCGYLLGADHGRRASLPLPVEKPRVCKTHVRRLQSRPGLDISSATNPPDWRRRSS